MYGAHEIDGGVRSEADSVRPILIDVYAPYFIFEAVWPVAITKKTFNLASDIAPYAFCWYNRGAAVRESLGSCRFVKGWNRLLLKL